MRVKKRQTTVWAWTCAVAIATAGQPLHADTDVLEFRLTPGSECVQPGQTVTVELHQRDLDQLVRGFQAFVRFDSTRMTLDSGTYTASPYGLPVIDPIAAVGDDIDMAAGIDDFAGQSPTTDDALLVTLTFTAGSTDGLTTLTFRPHDPPTRFSDETGLPVTPTLIDAPPIVIDGTPPVITCPADVTVECGESTDPAQTGEATATDNLDTTPIISFTDSVTPGPCPQASVITRTWTATDCAGNVDTCDQTITVQDSTPPVVTCPISDITVNADAGGCDAIVTYPLATATDNCDPVPTVACTPPSGSAFAAGTTTVTCTATDACGNEATCGFDVTVEPVNDVTVTVELAGVDADDWPAPPLARCIRFTARDAAGTCADPVDTSVAFFDLGGDRAVGTASFEVECGDWDTLCAKDEQHTLNNLQPLVIVGTHYELVDPTAAPLDLVPGDTDNDSDVDIHDITWLMYQWGLSSGPAAPGGCPWDGTRDADFNNDDLFDSTDYGLLSQHWHERVTCACAVTAGGNARPARPQVAVSTATLPPNVARAVDYNNDGRVDYKDVARFEADNGLPDSLSARLRKATVTRNDIGIAARKQRR
jgi:hypothetical protein